MELITGFTGLVLVGLAIVLAVVWILFPFFVLSRLSAQQRTLDAIAKSTKAQADFWRDRNVTIND